MTEQINHTWNCDKKDLLRHKEEYKKVLLQGRNTFTIDIVNKMISDIDEQE